MIIKKYNYLAKDAAQIRMDVFVKEQGFTCEFDDTDDIAVHLVGFDDLLPIATCRYYKDEAKDSYIVGRIAVIKDYRGKEIGSKILREVEKQISKIGGQEVYLAAQVKAMGFYERQGYAAEGECFFEDYCPHIWMYKSLDDISIAKR